MLRRLQFFQATQRRNPLKKTEANFSTTKNASTEMSLFEKMLTGSAFMVICAAINISIKEKMRLHEKEKNKGAKKEQDERDHIKDMERIQRELRPYLVDDSVAKGPGVD